VRVVPRVERGEFVNAGAILFCRTYRYLAAILELNRERLLALDPALDIDEVERHLAIIQQVCAGDPAGGPIASLTMAERFHWLVAPRSTVIQTSPVHSGMCDDPETALRRVVEMTVIAPH
jgi:hypothetical protein